MLAKHRKGELVGSRDASCVTGPFAQLAELRRRVSSIRSTQPCPQRHIRGTLPACNALNSFKHWWPIPS